VAVVEEPRAPAAGGGKRLSRGSGPDWYRQKWLHLAVGLAVAVLTVAFAGERAASGVRAGIDHRLVDAGAGADAGLVDVEAEQLSAARAVAFTSGVSGALAHLDGPGLSRLVTPIQANSTVPMVDVVEPDGRVVLAVRAKGAPAPVASRAGLGLLKQALRNARGARGGRYTALVIFRSGPTLTTISPIMNGRVAVGAVLAMTPLADVLGRLSQEVRVQLTAYDAAGEPVATTATFDPRPLGEADARSLIGGAAIKTRSVTKGYREKDGRLVVDHAAEAVLGVSMVDDSAATGRAVSIYAAIGLLCTVAILAGFWARFTRDRPRR